MAEKITVQIRLNSFGKATKMSDKIAFIQKAFEISNKRAHSLVQKITSRFDGCLILDLNYRQLARYTAMRVIQRKELNEYVWEYPKVIDFVETEEETEGGCPIELRPGFRTIETAKNKENFEDALFKDAVRWRWIRNNFHFVPTLDPEGSKWSSVELDNLVDSEIKKKADKVLGD